VDFQVLQVDEGGFMNSTIALIMGLVLRIGIPLAMSALVFFLLKKLDEHWQNEARIQPIAVLDKPCWEIKACPPEKYRNCRAAAKLNVPCWQTFRSKDGLMQEKCLGCEVFLTTPIPVRL
jgi:hypothetical protein